MPLEAENPEIPDDEELEVKSTGEVVEEEDGGDIAAAASDDSDAGEAEEQGGSEAGKDSSATPSTTSSSASSSASSENLDESDEASEPASTHEPPAADPFTRHTLTWDADTVERGVELTCQGEREREKETTWKIGSFSSQIERRGRSDAAERQKRGAAERGKKNRREEKNQHKTSHSKVGSFSLSLLHTRTKLNRPRRPGPLLYRAQEAPRERLRRALPGSADAQRRERERRGEQRLGLGLAFCSSCSFCFRSRGSRGSRSSSRSSLVALARRAGRHLQRGGIRPPRPSLAVAAPRGRACGWWRRDVCQGDRVKVSRAV